MNYKYILNIEGKILIIISLFILTIFPWMIYFREMSLMYPLLLAFGIPFMLGSLLLWQTWNTDKKFYLREAYFLVSAAWLTLGLFGSLPFYLTGTIPSFIDAFFESVSGFTTTGSSILTDIESLPRSILFWRSLTHWIGGMGIIVLVVAILPNLNIAGYQLFSAEMSGGLSSERIRPRAKDISKRLWSIYFFLTILVVFFLMLGGMDLFESICHSFGTVATGGFSTKNASVGHFSPYIQYVITVFMCLSGINFTVHYFALSGNFERVRCDTELKAYLLIILLTGLTITTILFFHHNLPLEQSFRDSFFQVISIITATGYATTDYLQWKEFAWFLIFMLMFVGACVGSTGGGIKVIRHVVAWKYIKRNFMSLMHPNMVKQIRINGTSISDDKAISIIAFMALYIFIIVFSTVFMSMLGLDMPTSIGAILATLGGIGPGIGDVGPAGNFSQIPSVGKVFLSFIMIIGRLEILTFMVLFTPSFWKK
jgi:trk system potassium uptake protein